ncbi:MAG: ComF family protein [Chloroflexota bacterium]
MKFWAAGQRLVAELQALLYPPRCASCGQSPSLLCDRCQRQIVPLLPPVCPLCGYPSANGLFCHRCQTTPPAIDGIRSVAFFEGPLREALHALKYNGLRAVAQPLGQLMARHWQADPLPADVILPVPLHRSRQRQRGYNQAAVLAGALAQEIGLPLRQDWLVRRRSTVSQTELDAVQRRENVAEAFEARADGVLTGKRVLLIDDVCTTGATLEACSIALRRAGAQSVWGFTLGRAR